MIVFWSEGDISLWNVHIVESYRSTTCCRCKSMWEYVITVQAVGAFSWSSSTVQAVVEHVPEDSNQEHMGTMGATAGN